MTERPAVDGPLEMREQARTWAAYAALQLRGSRPPYERLVREGIDWVNVLSAGLFDPPEPAPPPPPPAPRPPPAPPPPDYPDGENEGN